jgi:hypothetical protein
MAALGGFPTYRNDSTLYANDGSVWRPDISIEHHSHDGFTVWGTDRNGYLRHRRFIGYTTTEARYLFRRELLEDN